MKMQVGNIEQCGLLAGPHHQCRGVDLNDVPEPLHSCVVLFSLAAPHLSLALLLDWAERFAAVGEACGSGGGEGLGRSLAAGLIEGLGMGGAGSSHARARGQPQRSAQTVLTHMLWPVWLLPADV